MGFYCSATALEGYLRKQLKMAERILFGAAGVLLWTTLGWLNLVGAILMAVGIGGQFLRTPGDAPVGLEPAGGAPKGA